MPSWLPTSVVRAVMRGGLHGVAYRLHRAFSLRSLQSYMHETLGLTQEPDQAILLDVAQAARDAGQMATALPRQEALPVQLIPIVPSLPDSFWEGARAKWDVEVPWHSPDTGRSGTWRVSYYGSGPLTGQELLDEINAMFSRWAENSPEQFGADEFDLPGIVIDDVSVLDVERAW